jgi:AcrR family transcriptional regulator
MDRDPRLARRRKAVQRRSQETVAAIRTAAAQVFGQNGYRRATTNRVAQRAGVSIGTLYQYFPNKAALLVDLMEHHMEEAAQSISEQLSRSDPDAPAAELVRGFLTALMTAHAGDRDLHRILFEEAPHPEDLHDCVLRMERGIAHRLAAALAGRPGVAVPDLDTAAHLIVQAAESLIHRFVLHGIHEVEAQRFLDELVRLFSSYLAAGAPAATPA